MTDKKLNLGDLKLNSSAEALLDQLPDHAGQLVHSLATQYSIPIWQYTCAILLAVHMEGRLSEFRLDPAWKDGLRTKELICKHCGTKFSPRHIGQPFCSNDCGLAAAGQLHKEDKPNGPTRDPIPSKHSDVVVDGDSGWSIPDEVA
uniref:Uncharacterized protein n=1 Tax=viral metagenome TaxID=1070528 RepID=A0A6M3IJ19_9ZZZZ